MQRSWLILVLLTALLGSPTTARSAGSPADTAALEHLLDEWASAWSSSDVARLLPLFTNDVTYEDVTFGASSKGSDALRKFAAGTFDAFADLKFELKSRFVAAGGYGVGMAWSPDKGLPQLASDQQTVPGAWCHRRRVSGWQDRS